MAPVLVGYGRRRSHRVTIPIPQLGLHDQHDVGGTLRPGSSWPHCDGMRRGRLCQGLCEPPLDFGLRLIGDVRVALEGWPYFLVQGECQTVVVARACVIARVDHTRWPVQVTAGHVGPAPCPSRRSRRDQSIAPNAWGRTIELLLLGWV